MRVLTAELLGRLYLRPQERVAAFVAPIEKAFAEYGITTINARSAFLATVGHESAMLTRLSENLNYGATGLLSTWPNRYTPGLAARHARNPVMIANHVYANRMGNGDETSGDGWRYRGAGLIQLTGKDNQGRYSQATGLPVETVGDHLRKPEGAADSAGWFWSSHHLNDVSANGDMEAVTRVVNGGLNGLAERTALFNRAKGLLA
jgi:putative chitinase